MAERQAEPARQAQPGAATAARRRLGRVRGLVGEQQQKGWRAGARWAAEIGRPEGGRGSGNGRIRPAARRI